MAERLSKLRQRIRTLQRKTAAVLGVLKEELITENIVGGEAKQAATKARKATAKQRQMQTERDILEKSRKRVAELIRTGKKKVSEARALLAQAKAVEAAKERESAKATLSFENASVQFVHES